MDQQVLGQVHKKTKFLARKSKYLDVPTLKLLANALIQNNFDHACSCWYSSLSKALKDKLQTAQNKLIRVVLKLPPRKSLYASHFKALGWLKVEDRVAMFKIRMVHGVFYDSVPSYFRGYFTRVSDAHTYRTRASDTDVTLYKYKLDTVGKNTFAYTGASLWNKLPAPLKMIESTNQFKVALKKWFLDNLEG